MAKRKRQRHALPERHQLVMQRVEQRRDQPHTSPRSKDSNLHPVTVPSAPLFVQPSLFEGMASAFDLFPSMDDIAFMHLRAEQIEAISLLNDYLALAGDRARVDARFRHALYHALTRLSGELRAIKRATVESVSQEDQDEIADEQNMSATPNPHSVHRRLKFFDRFTPSHE